MTNRQQAHAEFALFLMRQGWSLPRIGRELGYAPEVVDEMVVYALEQERAA